MVKNELNVVKYIKKHGLDKTIEDFKLKAKDYGHKVLLKYDQIESDMSIKEVQECRGLILEKDTWKVMSLAFTKFFNSAESHAAKIDWDTAKVLKKEDGSLISLYWDWEVNKWCVSTTGMAEAEGEVNERPNTSFNDLFWETIKQYNRFDVKKLTKGFTYAFELMTPYNIVVCPHGESKVALLGIRDLHDLTEIGYDVLEVIAKEELGVPLVEAYDLNASNAGHLINTFEDMPWSEEGYVVVDANFNRIKLKNPAYVAAHHLKSKTNLYHILTIVKTNEIEEFGATFPERKDELEMLKVGYDKLTSDLENVWDELLNFKPKNITKEEQKKFAAKVFEVCDKYNLKTFSGLFFGLKDGKVDSVKDFLFNYDEKRLYELLSK